MRTLSAVLVVVIFLGILLALIFQEPVDSEKPWYWIQANGYLYHTQEYATDGNCIKFNDVIVCGSYSIKKD